MIGEGHFGKVWHAKAKGIKVSVNIIPVTQFPISYILCKMTSTLYLLAGITIYFITYYHINKAFIEKIFC